MPQEYLRNYRSVVTATIQHDFDHALITHFLFILRNDTVSPSHQVNGCNDDILDILVIPNPSNASTICDDNSVSRGIVEVNNAEQHGFKLAIITNSPQVTLSSSSILIKVVLSHS